MYFAPNARSIPSASPSALAAPSCGCVDAAVQAKPVASASLPVASASLPVASASLSALPRALTPFAPTTSWSSNLFGNAREPATGTGQVLPGSMASWETIASTAALAGTALGAYHGYRRTESLGWAVAWGVLGGLFPFITIPVALAQGFGKPEPAFQSPARLRPR